MPSNLPNINLSNQQKFYLLGLAFATLLGAGVYWFYTGNKVKIVKIKYYGMEGRATISKKDIQQIGKGIKKWSRKHLLHIGFSNQEEPNDSTDQKRIKIEFPKIEDKLEYIQTVVEVSKEIWKRYQEGDTIKIKYLPSDPQNYVLVLN